MAGKSRKTVLETRLMALCRRLLRALGARNCSVGVFLLNEAEMRRLGRLRRASLASLRSPRLRVGAGRRSGSETGRLRRASPRAGRKYIKKGSDYIPSVLSFVEPKRFPHPETRGKFLGEICLNRDLRPSGERRLGRLLIHGLLHISGYSHDKKSDTLKMEKLEKKLTQKFN
jgi:hypothetical protein